MERGLRLGEEAFSLAIVLHDLLGDDAYRRRVKIYATDVDEQALATARAGVFSARALEPIGTDRRDRYFTPEGADAFRFRSELRPSLIFGRHDLLRDAPISRVLLLSCRNVLMYLTPDSQRRVLERFSFALHPAGLLVLGKAEMLLTQSQLFLPVSLPQRVFRARRSASRSQLAALAVGGPGGDLERRRYTDAAFDAAPSAQVVLDEEGRVTLVNQRAQRHLPVAAGDVGRPFHELEVSQHPAELRGTVSAVQVAREVVELKDVPVLRGSAPGTHWDIRITPLEEDGQLLGVQLVYEDASERHGLRERLGGLHAELATAHEELESSSEELETTNEELQSAVEELETTNEELQSTNEELETMNEELQSTNEELQTLNDELRERTSEVDQSNRYLQAIVEGLEVALVVVDLDGRVQLWNSGAERLTGHRSFEAEGVPLAQLDLTFRDEEVALALRQVLHRGQARAELETSARNRFGDQHVRRLLVLPLRERTGEVTGAALTITEEATELG